MPPNTPIRKPGFRHVARRSLIASLLAACFMTAQAAEPVHIDIAAQPLAGALAKFAEQSGIKAVYPAALLAGKTAPRIEGKLTPQQALDKLLSGSGLRYQFVGNDAVRIEAIPPVPPAEKTTELSRIEIIGAAPASDYAVSKASTGTKTDTPLLETPLSIQVIPQQVLQDQNATTLDQVLRNVSGVKSDAFATGEIINLRGFTNYATFRNGLRLDDPTGAGIANLSNVDSVEVLKGPAAILYGRVEPGGIVNLVTKQPKATSGYTIAQSVGSYDHYVTDLDATGPLNEDKNVLYRFIATYDKAGSWRYGPSTQDQLGTEKIFIAPTLQWKVSPQTQVTLEAEYNHSNLNYDTGNLNPYVNNQIVFLPRNQSLITGTAKQDTTLVGLTWSHKLTDDWSIKHQTFYNRLDTDLGNYLTLNYANWPNIFTQVGSHWTTERGLYPITSYQETVATILDLTGHFETAGLKHTLLLGADYYRLKSQFGGKHSSTFVTTDAVNPGPVTGLAADPTLEMAFPSTTDNYGVHLQDQIKLPYGVQILGGLRYQKVHRTGGTQSGGAGGTYTPDAVQDDHAVTPRLGLLWQARDWLSLYGNYAENFGANTGRDFAGDPLKPESAQQYEVGAKAELLGGKLTTSLALFKLTKQNVATADPLNPGFNIAIGEVRSQGVEFDIQGELVPGWNAIATYTYTDAVITKSNNGDEGLRKANVPRNLASISTTYKLPQESLHGWKIGCGVFWRGAALDGTNTLITPGRTVVDAMAAYEFKTGQYKTTFQLNIDNVFDRRYYTDALFYANLAQFRAGAPRTATASVKLEF